MEHLLEVKNLRTSFFSQNGEVKAVNDVSFHVDQGEVVAIVGESGCGKSVTQMSVMRLVQSPPGRILGGEVLFEGRDLLKLPQKQMRRIRGAEISMIFQEPMTSLNPVFKVGSQISEVIRTHTKCSRAEAWKLGTQALEEVGIPDPARRMQSYPFEMSGGMRQRVMIATAVACRSKLIIADEPTTALDVTTQAQVMELLLELVRKKGISLIVVTHNLGLVTRYANRIYVMYAGKVVESGTTEKLLVTPAHPYTKGLLKSVPKLDAAKDIDLVPIKGAPPNLAKLTGTCAFMPRCPYVREECGKLDAPELRTVNSSGHRCACHFVREVSADEGA